MEDLQPQDVEALAAHVQGLEAALEALGSDASATTSLRRLARSLASSARAGGRVELAVRAQSLLELRDDELAGAARALLAELRGAPGATPTEHSAHVLIVEDNRTVATAVRAYLEAPGRTVRVAATASEAERILASEPIDLIVLDLILPDRDGRDLLLQIREQPDTATVPVVVLSAKGGTVARAECLAVGASEFLEKPADPKSLRQAVSRHITARRRSSEGTRDRATGLLNRAGIIDAHGAVHAHYGGMAVAILAVNELDDVSGTLGPESAAELLRRVASEIRGGLGEDDVLGRWSACELVVLLPGRSTAEAKTVLTRSLSQLARGDGLSAMAGPGRRRLLQRGGGPLRRRRRARSRRRGRAFDAPGP